MLAAEIDHRVHWEFVTKTTELKSEAAGLSYLRGAAVPLLNLTLSEALAETAGKFPDREGLVVCHQGVRLTWSELDREVTRAARGLAGLGLRPGHRAGIWASNCLEWVLLQYAAPRAGVILVNINGAGHSFINKAWSYARFAHTESSSGMACPSGVTKNLVSPR